MTLLRENKLADDGDKHATSRFVMYLTTLPFYREFCMDRLTAIAGSDLSIMSGPCQIGGSVRTGVSSRYYTPLTVRFLGNAAMVHFGGWGKAFRAESVIVDLNPRCVSAWILLALRRLMHRRTVVWGHLHPRSGPNSPTAALRRAMRKLASGTLLYGYDSVLPALQEVPNQPVWVAPNSLYPTAHLGRRPSDNPRDTVLYVGRLVAEKKVDLLIRAFALAEPNDVQLVIAGTGDDQESLERLSQELGCEARVKFLGVVTDKNDLSELYSRAICAVSPGYAGLSLTQSLGFGVPILVADDEPHAPEIELERFGSVTRFRENSPEALAVALANAVANPIEESAAVRLADEVAKYYSAETMAQGLHHALTNVPVELDDQGWPANV